MFDVKKCVIWDLDGVLANSNHRLHYIVSDRSNPDWDSFHKEATKDTILTPGYELFLALDSRDLRQFICTARPESNRKLTEQWLDKYGLLSRTSILFMRENNDHRPGVDVKRDMLRTILATGYDVLMAFEDHPDIVQMYRDHGVCCFAADPCHWIEEKVQKIAAEEKGRV